MSDLPQGNPIKGVLHTPMKQRVAYDPETDHYIFWVHGGSKLVTFPATEYDDHLRSARKAAYGPGPEAPA